MEKNTENSSQITQLLRQWSDGKREVLESLMPLIYDELRGQASRYLKKERSNHTLQTTALINEAYLKLIDQRQVQWQNRAHFFAIAAQAMRRILVDYARQRQREKRGGKAEDLVALDDALTRLEKFDERQARVVELRYFSGLSLDETAEVLGVLNVTVRRDWNMAKAWLLQEITR